MFSGDATAVQLPGTEGSLQILLDHAPMVATLQAGNVNIDLADRSRKTFAIGSGLVEVMKNQVVILSERVSGDAPAE